ncbi:MAG: adenylosuccinate lyase [Pseudomonadota bacterium]
MSGDRMFQEISPLDGRYRERVGHLGRYFSEYGLMAARLRVELDYLLALDRTGLWEPLSAEEHERVDRVMRDFGPTDFRLIKEIESITHHDVKACERFLRDSLKLRDPHRVHFGLTSEDVNNLAYNLLLRAFVDEQLLPRLRSLMGLLCDRAEEWASEPFPTRTHGQRATPSTAGKELSVFLSRLLRQSQQLASFRFSGKLGGATGTYAAMLSAFPGYDWIRFAEEFVHALGFEPNPVTTQIDDHDRWAELFDLLRRIANVVIDLDRDLWSYLSLGWLRERPVSGQVGSSTMPHKVNPIRFENSEGNLELAVTLLGALANKLTRSRMQRDLSDSTVSRNIGVALSHLWLGLDETWHGLQRLELDRERCRAELDDSPELLAEPIQSILRATGLGQDPYELLRERTRGQRVTREALMALVDSLAVGDRTKQRIHELQVHEYLGVAPALCMRVVHRARRELGDATPRIDDGGTG